MVSPSDWRVYQSSAYCYTIRLPVSAVLDTTDPANVRVRLSRAGAHPETGREVLATWHFDIAVAPNRQGDTPDDWLRSAHGAPDAGSIVGREDVQVARRKALRIRVDGLEERRDVSLVASGRQMYALSYPVVDLTFADLLKDEMPTFKWIVSTFSFTDPSACTPRSRGE
jgi:hypothetical protein